MYKKGVVCIKCNYILDNKNNEPRSYTVHHIYPKKFFKGDGPTAMLCRDCHNIADRLIADAGGMDNKLTQEKYWEIFRNWFYKQTEE